MHVERLLVAVIEGQKKKSHIKIHQSSVTYYHTIFSGTRMISVADGGFGPTGIALDRISSLEAGPTTEN